MTKIMGVRDASAMRPKPSVTGSLPRIVRASPTPRAVTSGTVTVEVVTPPESYASPTISCGAKRVMIMTRMYPPTISTGSGQPRRIRSTPTTMAIPTDSATVSRTPSA